MRGCHPVGGDRGSYELVGLNSISDAASSRPEGSCESHGRGNMVRRAAALGE